MNNAISNGQLPRRLARSLMRLYYPIIGVSHRECIPRSGPVLFVANHPNSLVDPPVIGWVTQRPVHFDAKAPLFKLPLLGGWLAIGGEKPRCDLSQPRGLAKVGASSGAATGKCGVAGV